MRERNLNLGAWANGKKGEKIKEEDMVANYKTYNNHAGFFVTTGTTPWKCTQLSTVYDN